jgi:hypothetical protein
MKLYYAGIGSRKSSPKIMETMMRFGQILAERGWVLRSGGAEGADKAFEAGCDLGKGEKEIFLPWKKFNGNLSPLYFKSKEIPNNIKEEAFALAAKYHPVWDQLSYGAKCLQARNGLQILGRDLNTPVSMVLFWSPMITRGGTSQALRIAADRGIMAYNMGSEIDTEKILDQLHGRHI